MLPGYNQKRPSAEDYELFVKNMKDKLDGKIEGLSLMLYGSYVRGDHNPGRSDIDAVMVFPDAVVINKENFGLVSSVLKDCLLKNYVPFQATVADLTTMSEGTFSSFEPHFNDYFDKEGSIIFGPDYRKQFTYALPGKDSQTQVRFNLRKARQGFLFSKYDESADYESFLRKFTKSLDAVNNCSKQLFLMDNADLDIGKFSSIDRIKKEFSHVNVKPLEKIKELYSDTSKLDSIYGKPSEVKFLWRDSITFIEELIRAYLANKK